MSDKECSKKGRGSFHQIVDNVVVVKWIDNKTVLLCSSFQIQSYPLGSIKCNIKNKCVAGRENMSNSIVPNDSTRPYKCDVTCPQIVNQYNVHMEGVDVADMLVASYWASSRTN